MGWTGGWYAPERKVKIMGRENDEGWMRKNGLEQTFEQNKNVFPEIAQSK
jgi:hypothetical protein